MFEKEITRGNHVSYHFCVDKFANNFHPKSKQHLIEKELSNIDLDLSKYECNITTENTTSEGNYFHVSYLKKQKYDRMDDEVLKYFNINVNFPVIYFTRKLPLEKNFKCGFYLETYRYFNSKFLNNTLKTLEHFNGLYDDFFLAGDFDENGNFIDESINIEIIPIQSEQTYYAIKKILLENFDIDENKLNPYDRKFINYEPKKFSFHIKIKFTTTTPIVKIYRSYPINPFISYYFDLKYGKE
jgi:hypothetical protein